MLANAAAWVVARSGRAVVVGRNQERLRAVAGGGVPGAVTAWRLDVRDTAALRAELRAQMAAHGAFDLALVWLHDDSAAALPVIAEHVGSASRPGRLVVVLGCEAEQPGRGGTTPEQAHARPGALCVQATILGWVRTPSGSRWLTHGEISGGVVASMETGAERTIIGVVEPWGTRP